ncbi:hypothetical protein PV11_00860 [Exophiala sideris]|uniref:Uncharacterized protein n=1 Tax=Exophiala sideris TaxID=1016849 RepID=A0A0D1W8P6_9EURO|nr:hypothetical protein PV11_00860 [Exophiala sideris]
MLWSFFDIRRTLPGLRYVEMDEAHGHLNLEKAQHIRDFFHNCWIPEHNKPSANQDLQRAVIELVEVARQREAQLDEWIQARLEAQCNELKNMMLEALGDPTLLGFYSSITALIDTATDINTRSSHLLAFSDQALYSGERVHAPAPSIERPDGPIPTTSLPQDVRTTAAPVSGTDASQETSVRHQSASTSSTKDQVDHGNTEHEVGPLPCDIARSVQRVKRRCCNFIASKLRSSRSYHVVGSRCLRSSS